MSEEQDALLALKNAWTGAIATADRLQEVGPAVTGLGAAATIADVDLDALSGVVLAHANAAQALRGLIEQLRRKYQPAA
jgi:hypothetical protein